MQVIEEITRGCGGVLCFLAVLSQDVDLRVEHILRDKIFRVYSLDILH